MMGIVYGGITVVLVHGYQFKYVISSMCNVLDCRSIWSDTRQFYRLMACGKPYGIQMVNL